MSPAIIRGRLPRLSAKAAASGGAFSGAKMAYLGGANLAQLAGGGFVWDTITPDGGYDTDGYIQTYGANANNAFDDNARVFKVPSDGIYEITGNIYVLTSAGIGVFTDAMGNGPRLWLDSTGIFPDQTYTAVHTWNASTTPNARFGQPSPIVWTGIIRAGADGLRGLWVQGTSIVLVQRSWMAIKRLGDAP